MSAAVLAQIEIGWPVIAVIVAVVVLGGLVVVTSVTRRDTDTAVGYLARETVKSDKAAEITPQGEAAPVTGREIERLAEAERKGELVTVSAPGEVAPFVPPDPEAIGVSRRQFFNRSIVAFFGLGLSGFGAAVLAFLWPQPKGGFGSRIFVGSVGDVQSQIEANNGFYYLPEGRMWITSYPAGAVEKARAVYPEAVMQSIEAGLMVLYQKCPHLGCKVPSCPTSQWFECPCHGSQYNQAGEKKGGPAPRGMDLFATEVSGGALTVDTGQVLEGMPIGVNTTGQEAEGPHCVTGGGGH